MSPRAALHNPVFRDYLVLTLCVLALSGIVLLLSGAVLRKNVRPVWLTYRSWLVMVAVIGIVIFLGRTAVIAGTTLLSIFAFKEFARATGLYRDWWMTGAVYLAVIAVGVVALVHDPFTGEPGWLGMFLALPVYAVSLLFIIPILRNRTDGQLQAMSLSMLGFIYIGWMFGHLTFLANARGAYGYVLFILFATEVGDVAAWSFGKLWGRHPLRANISPRKTAEGALGALAISMLLPWALRFSFPHFSGPELVLTGLIVGIGGQLGDLCISVIKRDIGIKDMGRGIPGHGGVLDRIDSLIFVTPLFFHLVNYFHGIR